MNKERRLKYLENKGVSEGLTLPELYEYNELKDEVKQE